MLVRVVKMTFSEDAIDAFKVFLNERKQQIRNFEGCMHLELWQDKMHSNIFFTYSHWEHETRLTIIAIHRFLETPGNKPNKCFQQSRSMVG